MSPQQISGTLARMEPPQRISHESIYTALYAMPKGELRAEIIALLRKRHKGRRPRTAGQDRRGLIVGMTSIEERPLSVEDRLMPGHWEGDLIKGAFNRSQVGTLVERSSLLCWCSSIRPQPLARPMVLSAFSSASMPRCACP